MYGRRIYLLEVNEKFETLLTVVTTLKENTLINLNQLVHDAIRVYRK